MILVEELRRLIESIDGISFNDLNEISEFLDHDEWGLAFEVLCAVIEQDDIIITLKQYKEIEVIGNKMKMDSNLWNGIKTLR